MLDKIKSISDTVKKIISEADGRGVVNDRRVK